MTLIRCKARKGTCYFCLCNTRRGYYCKEHAKRLIGVQVKRSTIKGAGLGLFATRTIKKGEIIEEYTGTVITAPSTSAKIFYKYGILLDDGGIIDSGRTVDCFSRYINDGRSSHRNNCEFFEKSGRVYVKAIKTIKEGEELFVSYGSTYW